MTLYPPDDPFLINTVIFGIPLVIRWYGLLIMSGAVLGAFLNEARARKQGFDPEQIWNQLMLGLILGIAGARIYYVAFERARFGNNFFEMLNLTTGGLAIHGAIIGALLAAVIYTRRHKLPFWHWVDLCVPGLLLAQALGRWGNFFNQEAYGCPTSTGFGLLIDPIHRISPYDDLQKYPPTTLFHPTFLYESLWNLLGVGLILLLERHFGSDAPSQRRWLRKGDLFFFYGAYYSFARFWIEGLRTDSLCLNGFGGDCVGSLRVAQVVSLLIFCAAAIALIVNHQRTVASSASNALTAKEIADPRA